MQGVKAGRNLHSFHFVNRFPVRKMHAGMFKRHASVGERVFYHKILGDLRIDKRRNIGSLNRAEDVCIVKFGLDEQITHLFGRPGRDLVDHGPWE